MRAECLHDKRGSGATERTIEQVAHEALLGFVARGLGDVDVCARRLITCDQAFLGHDLHELQRRGVTGLPHVGKRFEHLPDGGRSLVPQHLEDCQFCVGRSCPELRHINIIRTYS